MRAILSTTFIPMLLCLSCNGIDLPADLPDCLEGHIKDFKKEKICKDKEDIGVYEYIFQERTVFLFGRNCCCDVASTVLDYECNMIGHLGGFDGNTKINGEEFSNAVLVRTICEKN